MIMIKYFLFNFIISCVVVVFLTKLLVSTSDYLNSLLYKLPVLLHHLFLKKSIRTDFNLSTSNLSTLLLKLFKLLGTFLIHQYLIYHFLVLSLLNDLL